MPTIRCGWGVEEAVLARGFSLCNLRGVGVVDVKEGIFRMDLVCGDDRQNCVRCVMVRSLITPI